MLRRATYDRYDYYPGPSSQTTTQWPLTVELGEELLRSTGVSLNGGNLILQSQRELTWNQAVDELMEDRADLWSELSEL